MNGYSINFALILIAVAGAMPLAAVQRQSRSRLVTGPSAYSPQRFSAAGSIISEHDTLSDGALARALADEEFSARNGTFSVVPDTSMDAAIAASLADSHTLGKFMVKPTPIKKPIVSGGRVYRPDLSSDESLALALALAYEEEYRTPVDSLKSDTSMDALIAILLADSDQTVVSMAKHAASKEPKRSVAASVAVGSVAYQKKQIAVSKDVCKQPDGWSCGYYALYHAFVQVNDEARGTAAYEPDLVGSNVVKFKEFFKWSKAFLNRRREVFAARRGVKAEAIEGSLLLDEEITALLDEFFEPGSLFFRDGGPFKNRLFAHFARGHICCPARNINREVIIDAFRNPLFQHLIDVEGIHATLRFSQARANDFVVVVYNVRSGELFRRLTPAEQRLFLASAKGTHWVCCKFSKNAGGVTTGLYADSAQGGDNGLASAQFFARMLTNPDLPSRDEM